MRTIEPRGGEIMIINLTQFEITKKLKGKQGNKGNGEKEGVF